MHMHMHIHMHDMHVDIGMYYDCTLFGVWFGPRESVAGYKQRARVCAAHVVLTFLVSPPPEGGGEGVRKCLCNTSALSWLSRLVASATTAGIASAFLSCFDSESWTSAAQMNCGAAAVR